MKAYWTWRCLVVSQAAQVIVHRVGMEVPSRQIGAGFLQSDLQLTVAQALIGVG
ncbi:MAG: hypothetical protein ACK5N0_06870 [Synechococcaceae cyanobacterium]